MVPSSNSGLSSSAVRAGEVNVRVIHCIGYTPEGLRGASRAASHLAEADGVDIMQSGVALTCSESRPRSSLQVAAVQNVSEVFVH